MNFRIKAEQLCQKRNNEWGKKVKERIQHAIDLHAADALYHNKCSIEISVCLSSDEQVTCSAKKSKRGRPLEEERSWAFKKVIEYLRKMTRNSLL